MKAALLRCSCLIALCLVFRPWAFPAQCQTCTVQAEDRMIQTYPYGDPDPVPNLTRNPAIYPYFFFDGYSRTASERLWKEIRLENDYIRVWVLPGVGGKISGAVEKSSGFDFIYHNTVLKFRQIAMRGPWTSGGIEFNFGIVGHTPTVAAPVDYALRTNPDGSVSCFVGAMDLTSRTRWTTEITLFPDRASFTTKTTWVNPSPLHESYYAWSNNAVHAREDLQYFYPGNRMRPHGPGPMDPWPVDSLGRDLSWYRNHAFGGDHSHFVMGLYTHFFGGYWHDADIGFAHWSLYDDMPGKKMWIWALSRQGGIWENLLTDRNGQYSEPQSGRLLSQDDHAFFAPYSTDYWEETYFPFRGTGGLSDATPFGALHVTREGRRVSIRISAAQPLDEDLTVSQDGRETYREHITLLPLQVHRAEASLPDTGRCYSVSLGGKLRYSSDTAESALSRPIRYSIIDESTTEGLYLAAVSAEKRRDYTAAFRKYQAVLGRDSLHVRSLTRLAELSCRRMEYDAGLRYASSSLSLDKYDPDANYIYGVIARRKGLLTDAKETLGWAARAMEYRSNAYCQLAEIAILEKEYERSAVYAGRAADFNPAHVRAHELAALLHRLNGQEKEAMGLLSALENRDPLNHLVRFERFCLAPSDSAFGAFSSMIRCEFPLETYLELASFYAELGLCQEACLLLEKAPRAPMALLGLAYLLRMKDAGRSEKLLDEALALSARMVFPFREESLPVLEWAAEQRPEHWKPKYYLALLFWHKGRPEKAAGLLEACSKPDFSPFHILMARMHPEEAELHLTRAWNQDKKDWRTWHELIRLYEQSGRKEGLDLARRAVRRFPDSIVLSMDLVSSLYTHGRYGSCASILDTLEVLPYEGGWEAHLLYRNAQIRLALEDMKRTKYTEALASIQAARAYPEHLGTGEPYEPDFRMQDWLEAECRKRLGDPTGAAQARSRILSYTLEHWDSGAINTLFGYFALKESGEKEKCAYLEGAWEKANGNALMQWYSAVASGHSALAQAKEKEITKNPAFALVRDVLLVTRTPYFLLTE